MNLEPWPLALALAGALLVGVAKTGIAGLGILVAAIFANLLPARESSGFVLPMLVFGDLVAVSAYRRHAQTRHLLRLFPWTALGVAAGAVTLGRIDDAQARSLIGAIVACLVLWHLARRRGIGPGLDGGSRLGGLVAPFLGLAAGFTTLVANAAGPIMSLYLLAMGLPKLEFAGTAAVFFLVVNLFKVPFMAGLGLITWHSLAWNAALLPAVWLGTWLGKRVLQRIPQAWFENTALALSAAAAVNLLL